MFLAKCLSGENRDEGFYIWTGSGGNGKSKLHELAGLVLGDYSGGLPVSLITGKRASSNSGRKANNLEAALLFSLTIRKPNG